MALPAPLDGRCRHGRVPEQRHWHVPHQLGLPILQPNCIRTWLGRVRRHQQCGLGVVGDFQHVVGGWHVLQCDQWTDQVGLLMHRQLVSRSVVISQIHLTLGAFQVYCIIVGNFFGHSTRTFVHCYSHWTEDQRDRYRDHHHHISHHISHGIYRPNQLRRNCYHDVRRKHLR
jgi:hypothetical protein